MPMCLFLLVTTTATTPTDLSRKGAHRAVIFADVVVYADKK